MKFFDWMPVVVIWMLGLAWYEQWSLAIGVVVIFMLLLIYTNKKYGWPKWAE